MSADDLSSYLLNDHRHAKISPESLELMGKQAANLFLDEGVALNESVVKLASAHQDISHEQVKRVCEFANTAVYLATHDKNKVAGAASSYPTFELADPNRVIQDLSDGARPTVLTPVDVSYGQQPLKKEKVSSAFSDAALAGLFGYTAEKAKVAHYTTDTAVSDVMATKDLLRGTKENLEHHAQSFEMAHKQASAEYYDLVKRHLLDGGSFTDVMAAARASSSEDEKVASVMQPVVERLLSEKVASRHQLQAGVRNLEKVAHRVINDAHPFVTTFRSVLALNDEMDKVATALDEVDQQLREVNLFVKEQLLARASR